jgi:tryptophanyl-tRNA synthetase
MSIQTDSTPVEDPKNPEQCNVFAIFRLLAEPAEVAEVEAAYRKGGLGYGTVKKRLAELYEQHFGPARERRAALAAPPDHVEDVLADGATRARAVAEQTMQEVREACGLVTGKGVDA